MNISHHHQHVFLNNNNNSDLLHKSSIVTEAWPRGTVDPPTASLVSTPFCYKRNKNEPNRDSIALECYVLSRHASFAFSLLVSPFAIMGYNFLEIRGHRASSSSRARFQMLLTTFVSNQALEKQRE